MTGLNLWLQVLGEYSVKMTYTISVKFDLTFNALDTAEAIEKTEAFLNAITYKNPQAKELSEKFDLQDLDFDIMESSE